MLTLRPSQVPEYLRTSSFFLGLNVVDDDEFSIPVNHMKFDTNVRSLNDMTELLNTIRFWGIDIFPQTLVDFAARQLSTEIESILEPYRADLPLFTTVCCIASEIANSEVRLEKAMDTGNIEIVRYFHKEGVPFTTRAIALAAGKGALDCLQYALGDVTTNSPDNCVFSEAVRNGCMDCIHFLQQRGFPLAHTVDLAEIAASSGQCGVLKYLHSQGCSIQSAAIAAAGAGHFDCLEYATKNGALLRGEYSYARPRGTLAQRLARANQLKLYPLALSRESGIDAQTALSFVNCEKWEFFWKRCVDSSANLSIDVIAAVARKGHLTYLKSLHQFFAAKAYARGNGLNWITYADRISDGSILRPADIAQLTADAEQWECLQFLITHGCPMNKPLTTSLVQAGQLELYHLATAHGCKVSVWVACTFAREGNLDLLQHALDHGCERSEEILLTAVQHDQLQCLMHAHAQGCPRSAQVTLAAARGGHLECLQYLHEQGCHTYLRSACRKQEFGTKWK